MPVKLYLIRHAEPFFPEGERVFLGKAQDHPLSDAGRLQAEALAESLSDAGIARIFSSPMKRCLETAEPLKAASGCGITVLDELKELDPGDWAGRKVSEVRAEYGERFKDGSCFPPPGGESDASGLVRAKRALEIIGKEDGSAAIVSHAGLIRLMLCLMTGFPSEKKRIFDVRCAVPLTVTVSDGGLYLPDPHCFRASRAE